MSEPVLKAIIKLFALVAKEDTVTHQEREYIHSFLEDHLSRPAMERHLKLFDEYAQDISEKLSTEKENELISEICSAINIEVTQKQKLVVLLELMSIVLADGTISPREDRLTKLICSKFNVAEADLESIKAFVTLQDQDQAANENFLIVSSRTKQEGKFIYRDELDGFITILHVPSVE